jgi:hypothetical protein
VRGPWLSGNGTTTDDAKRFLEKNEDMTNSIYDEERSKHLMSDQVRA